MIKDFKTYINEGLFDRNQSEFNIRKTDNGVEQVYVPKTKDDLYKYIDLNIEQAKKDGIYPNVDLNNIDVSELGNDELKGLFNKHAYAINPDISDWNIKSIPNSFFAGNEQIKEFTISDIVTSIGDWAFYDCYNIKKTKYTGDIAGWCSINFGGGGSNPTKYSHNLYINDVEVKDLVIPNSVTSIGDYAFAYCSGLTSVIIPNSVTSIGDWAFYECSGLTSVTIPNSVTSIGDLAFYNCSDLNSVTIGNSVTSIGDSAFYDCSGLTSIVVESGNTTYDSRNGCNAIIETATNTLVVGCQSTIIPNSVTSIGECAFYNCSGLTSVTIPNSVTSIGDYAFYGCSDLKDVTISKHCIIYSRSFQKNCKIIRK